MSEDNAKLRTEIYDHGYYYEDCRLYKRTPALVCVGIYGSIYQAARFIAHLTRSHYLMEVIRNVT